jgi:hypothetical protein
MFVFSFGFNESYIEKIKDTNYLIYNYQRKKIEDTTNLENIFLGDSSLGNAIDIDYFNAHNGNKSINLALNRIYGFAGQYNLLREVIKKNRNIKKIFIVNSIFFLNSDSEDESFFLTSKNFGDFFIARNKISFITYSYKYWIKSLIVNYRYSENEYNNFFLKNINRDYIVQNKNLKFSEMIDEINIKNIDYDKKYFYLKKIVSLCKDNGIDVFFFHGPLYSSDYNKYLDIIRSNKIFYEKLNIKYYPFFYKMKKDEIGDLPLHSNYKSKIIVTKAYINYLKKIKVIN